MTNLMIIHGGQTGVDRGAHVAALEANLAIGGYMPSNKCDEKGLIPADVAKYLQPSRRLGFAARTQDNLLIAHRLLVVVQDKQAPYATPGTKLTLKEARDLQIRTLVVDPTDTITLVHDWIANALEMFASETNLKLMVAGPRESKWPGAQQAGAWFLRTWKAPSS